jgi:hypothetical protein
VSELEIRPGWQRRAFAAALVIIAVTTAAAGPLSARFTAAGLVLFAIDLAFIPSPSFHLTLREIYGQARGGWRMPWKAKLLSAAAFILLATGFYLMCLGR